LVFVSVFVVAVSASAQAPAAPVAQAPTICGNQPLCYEAPDFAATITDFRTSQQGHIVDVAVRFTNKTNNLLVLGYTNGSGVATDERGNRYPVWGGNGVRGMGLVNGQSVDPKFQVRPGGYGDTRFELALQGYPQVIGFTFELDLSVNEINAYAGNQFTVGSEFPLTWKGLANGATGAAPGAVAYAGGNGTTGGTLTSIPCQNSTVQNVANGANNAATTVSSAVSSIGSLFGKKQQPQAASSATPTVPCTPAAGATTTTTSTGAVATSPAATNATTAAAKPAATAAATAAKSPAPQAAVATTPAKKVTPTSTTPPAQPASTQPKPNP
jgi:hypothetical protein